LNPTVNAPENVPEMAKIQTMPVEFDAIAQEMESTAEFVQSFFLP
jgi:hypothetical protein